ARRVSERVARERVRVSPANEASRRRLRPRVPPEYPALAEDDHASRGDAGPVRHVRTIEPGEVADRLKVLLADRDEERDESARADAAVDDGDHLDASRRPGQNEPARSFVPTHREIGKGEARGARGDAVTWQLDLVREDRGAKAGVRRAPQVVVGQLG